MPRTNQEILDQINELARIFYRLRGHQVPRGHRFDDADRVNRYPDEVFCWQAACEAQELLTGTDLDDVLSEIKGL